MEDSTPASPGIKIRINNPPYVLTQPTDLAVTSTSWTTVFQAPVQANYAYEIEGQLVYQVSASTTGMKVNVWGPSGATAIGNFTVQRSSYQADVRPWSTAGDVVAAISTNYISEFRGVLRAGATAGNAVLQVGTYGAGTLTIGAGSHFKITRLGPLSQPTVTLAANLGAAAYYTQNAVRFNTTASASQTLKVKTDGTWAITRSAQSDSGTSGTPLTGSWVTPTTADIGNGYEVRFVVNSGNMGVSNGAQTWTVITSDCPISIYTTAQVGTIKVGTQSITVEIRKIGTTTPVCSSTITFNSSVESMTNW